MAKKNGPPRLNRRQALMGLGGAAATPLLAGHGMGAQSQRGSEPPAEMHTPEVIASGRDQPFDRAWRFHRGDLEGAELPEFDDSQWRMLDLPHDWSIEDLTPPAEAAGQGTVWVGGNAPTRVGPFDVALSEGQEATGWVVGGTGWYRKRFPTRTSESSEAEIRFDGVYMNADVWINGHHVGYHPYGYTSFAYNLAPHLHHDGENVLAVRVRNVGKNSRWYSGSGIYRHVWMTVTGKVRFPLWGVSAATPKVAADVSTVQLSVRVENRGNSPQSAVLRERIIGPDGEIAHTEETRLDLAPAEQTIAKSFDITSPKLWSHETPYLYRAEIELLVSGLPVDRTSVTFGIRAIEVDVDHGLRINGEVVKLKGGCVHHDNGILGAAAIDRAEQRRVEILKANGFNAIRTSHNPPSPAFLDACDRFGMMVIDEAFDCWTLPKIGDDEDYHRYFHDWWERDLGGMVLRDRNHPSVICWSIGNEIDGRNTPEGVAIARQLYDAVKSLDDARPVTMAVPGPYDHNLPEWHANDPSFLHVDVGGYNYQWQQYEPDHQRFPQRIMMGTESFPIEAYNSWRYAERLSYVLGDFVWTAIDYFGESAIGHTLLSQTPAWWRAQYPWFISYCGDIDAVGHKKPQSYYRDVLWGQSTLEMAVQRPLPFGRTETLASWGWVDEVRSWTWPGVEGKPLNVRIYTAGDEVKLLLNGKEVGAKPVPESAQLIAEFQVPYQAGELMAVALKNGKTIASQTLKTVGKPARLRLTADRQTLRASRNDLAFVTVEMLDSAGSVIPDGVRTIEFQIAGVGELAAAGSANPKDVSSFRQPTCRTFRGKSMIILRPSGRAGAVRLEAKSQGLLPATLLVNCTLEK